jgi:hypothetical protein
MGHELNVHENYGLVRFGQVVNHIVIASYSYLMHNI